MGERSLRPFICGKRNKRGAGKAARSWGYCLAVSAMREGEKIIDVKLATKELKSF